MSFSNILGLGPIGEGVFGFFDFVEVHVEMEKVRFNSLGLETIRTRFSLR